MTPRKSPHKHRVREHERNGKLVTEHTRGKGNTLRRRVPTVKKRKIYTPLSEFAKMGVLKKRTAIQKKEKMYYADWSIVDHIDAINAMGFETFASCSGTKKDHRERAVGVAPHLYVLIILPRSVASYEDGIIKDWNYLNRLKFAAEHAGWTSFLMNKHVDISTSHYPLVKLEYSKMNISDEEIARKWTNLVRELSKITGAR